MPSPRAFSPLIYLLLGAAAVLHACSGSGTDPAADPTGASGDSAAGTSGGGGSAGDGGAAGSAGGINIGGGTPEQFVDPKTCEEAANGHTYTGCDFWPTVLDNIVRPEFDYAVVAANPGDEEAEVTVERAGSQIGKAKVPPGGLIKLYLPWVEDLKSSVSIFPGCPTNVKTATVLAKQGAYHLTSTRPVALYQFNALEYAGKGGPASKDWASCNNTQCPGNNVGCFSYTNDASLLLPSTALSGTYRIAGAPSWQSPSNSDPGDPNPSPGFTYPPYFSVTAFSDNTQVNIKLSATAAIAGGSGLADVPPGGSTSFTINKGDVVLLVGKDKEGVDFSGTLVTSSAPIQVLTGISCTNMPHDKVACDHLEESVLPAETLGKHYFVTAPTGPGGSTMGHIVRIYGNVDGTQLTYPGPNPGGPSTINAGEFFEFDGTVTTDFEVLGDHEFTVASFQVGAGFVTNLAKGDPAQSFAVTIEQYRKKYIFLSPDDYDESYADVVLPEGAQLTLDGSPVSDTPSGLSSGYGVLRLKLGPGKGGAHVLEGDKPFGLQVMGYGAYTSYQYPGGLNLGFISPPPIK